MQELKQRLARLLLEKSYIEGEVVLTSGKKSDYYFDCKPTALHPEGSYLLGNIFLSMLNPDIEAVAGITLGGDPLVTSITLVSYLKKRPIPALIVRKEPKGHGTNRFIEGISNVGEKASVALVEDVVTTGGSVLRACKAIEDAGFKIGQILCVLDREEGGYENIEKAGYKLTPIFTRGELLASK